MIAGIVITLISDVTNKVTSFIIIIIIIITYVYNTLYVHCGTSVRGIKCGVWSKWDGDLVTKGYL